MTCMISGVNMALSYNLLTVMLFYGCLCYAQLNRYGKTKSPLFQLTANSDILRLSYPDHSPLANPVAQGPWKNPEVGYKRQRSVVATCKENSILVVVQRDLLGVGQLIQPSEVKLGDCAPTGQDDSAKVLLFETELQDCGSTLRMTAHELVYSFTLLYVPRAFNDAPIIRSNGASVSIECHYPRLHNVSSSVVDAALEKHKRREKVPMVFRLKLISDDWQSERVSRAYVLGDLINIEASVSVARHMPLRLFVDSCVATSGRDMESAPRYVFIEEHGCLTDSKKTGSRSQFFSRLQNDKLRFQLDAFRFTGEARSTVFITCILKATLSSAATDYKHKACSFYTNGWTSSDDDDKVCDCCDVDCTYGSGVALEEGWQSEVSLGPVFVYDRPRVGFKNAMRPN